MSKLQIYDKAMCCSTGVCGPQVDPVLPQFSADLDWLKNMGHEVERFNLAQNADEFVKNTAVQQTLQSEGVECLPLVIVNDRIVSHGEYPSRQELSTWAGTGMRKSVLPLAPESGDCCSDPSAC